MKLDYNTQIFVKSWIILAHLFVNKEIFDMYSIISSQTITEHCY